MIEGGFCKSLLNYSIVPISIYLIFFICCIATSLICYLSLPLLPSFLNTPIYIAFQTPTYIYAALIVNIAIYLPSLLDLMSDWRKNRDPTFQDQADAGKKHDSLLERAFMAFINIPSALILLILHNDKNVAHYCTAFHVPQFVGNLGAVLILCRKLVPEYFTSVNILGAQFSLAIGITLGFAMFGQSGGYLLNVLVIVTMMINIYFIFIRILRSWFMDLGSRVLFGEESITISELCALWYFLSALFIAVFVPMALAVRGGFNMANSDLYDVCTVIFSYSLFGIIINTIPGHLAKNAVEREKKKSLQTKASMVRYMGHEVRSPLNVLVSGLRILKADIVKLQLSLEDRATLMDTVESMQQESEELVRTINNLLQLEKMESSAFFIEEEMVPCSHLLEMAAKFSVPAREKGINFSVRSQLDQQPAGMAAVMPAEDDIERGGSEDIKVPDPPTAHSICIDELKMGQVIRNLIMNAIKFTPPENAVTVTLRHATAADLADEVSQGNAETSKKKGERTPVDKSGYIHSGHVVFEVEDSGVGLAKNNWDKIFGQFKQFDANVLQGGGGSGLGLWISQEIVKLHGSRIRFHSDGEGHGIRFYFLLPCYKADEEVGVVHNQTTIPASPSLTQLFWSRAAQDSPEPPQSSDEPDEDVDNQFSCTARRVLNRPGQCKVLVVDDSKAAQGMRSAGFKGLIVGVTGNVMAHDVANYVASGADCVVFKPVNTEELKQIFADSFLA